MWTITKNEVTRGMFINTGEDSYLMYYDAQYEFEREAVRQNWEDIQRIVAAVNATKGISTEALEAGIVKELLEAASNLNLSAHTLPNDTGNKFVSVDQDYELLISANALHALRAAIAKAEGKE